jgi:hypothetical protein
MALSVLPRNSNSLSQAGRASSLMFLPYLLQIDVADHEAVPIAIE